MASNGPPGSQDPAQQHGVEAAAGAPASSGQPFSMYSWHNNLQLAAKQGVSNEAPEQARPLSCIWAYTTWAGWTVTAAAKQYSALAAG